MPKVQCTCLTMFSVVQNSSGTCQVIDLRVSVALFVASLALLKRFPFVEIWKERKDKKKKIFVQPLHVNVFCYAVPARPKAGINSQRSFVRPMHQFFGGHKAVLCRFVLD